MKSFTYRVLFGYFLIVFSTEDSCAQDSTRKAISYFNQTELGLFIYHNHTEYGSGSDPTSDSGGEINFQMVNGLLICRHYAVGFGIDIPGSYKERCFILLHAQYQWRTKGIVTFLYGEGGSSIGGSDEVASYGSGPVFAIGSGMQTKSRFHFVMSIGYLYVQKSYRPNCHFCNWQDITDQGATVRIGFGF
jgi:hypothetical protein